VAELNTPVRARAARARGRPTLHGARGGGTTLEQCCASRGSKLQARRAQWAPGETWCTCAPWLRSMRQRDVSWTRLTAGLRESGARSVPRPPVGSVSLLCAAVRPHRDATGASRIPRRELVVSAVGLLCWCVCPRVVDGSSNHREQRRGDPWR
jgi:hypothetical protein